VTSVLAAAMIVLLASDPLTTRIEDSAAAAQALQGPFDGAWTLRDGAGRIVFGFQMSEPPGSVGKTAPGAWRDEHDTIGAAEFIAEGPRRLRIVVAGEPRATVILTERRAGTWRGSLPGHGVVTLTRSLARPRPAV
jgi:hypothetical protein